MQNLIKLTKDKLVQHHEVKDGTRTLQFEGELLGSSSSEEPGKSRWVEFALYKTRRGQYIISRVGISITYHTEQCSTVVRNRLSLVSEREIPPYYIPCANCKPQRLIDDLYPETPRYWAQVSESARGVISLLMKYDENDVAYLTNVAKNLLETSAVQDIDIYNAYSINFIE